MCVNHIEIELILLIFNTYHKGEPIWNYRNV